MDNIPNDLIPFIFDNIKLITDKRQFLRTCKTIHTITKELMKRYENILSMKYFSEMNHHHIENFALELCHDKYFNLIPLTYLIPTNNFIIAILAIFGNLELLQIAINNGCKLNDYDIYLDGIAAGEKEIDKLYEEIFNVKLHVLWTWDTCALASFGGNVNIIKFCLNNGCKLKWICPFMAAKNNQLDTLKWLKINNCEFNDCVVAIAGLNGHCVVLEWLIQNGCEIDEDIISTAAVHGNINVLEVLKNNGCINYKVANEFAAAFGQINVLIWLKENGYTGDKRSCTEAAYGGQLNAIKWLLKNGFECNNYDVYDAVISEDHYHIFEWLIDNGYELDKHKICDLALSYQNANIIEWLTKNNYQWSKEDIDSINDLSISERIEDSNWAKNILNIINKK